MPAASEGQPSVSGRQLDSRDVHGNPRRGDSGVAETGLLLLTVSFWATAAAWRQLVPARYLILTTYTLPPMVSAVDPFCAATSIGVPSSRRKNLFGESARPRPIIPSASMT